MPYFLRTSLFVSILFLFGFGLQAQQASVGARVVGVYSEQQPCLSSAEHAEIQQMLQTKLALLKLNGAGARQTAAHPTFSFPLQWAKERPPYGFWTISNYVDLNPALGPNEVNQYSTFNQDYNCGNRTYDQRSGYQHQGTDFALWPFNWSVMAGQYVKVVAAAPGTILSKSDGNDDQNCGSFASATSDWNAVYVRHDDGSVAWYGHLKKQSLTTKLVGQRVQEGEFLGYIGSSGRSSAPHLHFEVYNAEGKLIDPFQGACNKTITDAWWKDQPIYKDKTLNRLSVHLKQPVMGQCPASANATNEIQVAQPGQVFYFYTFGRELEPGDAIKFTILKPDGQLFTEYTGNYTDQTAINFYWYLYTTIPADAPEGEWKFRSTFNGKTYEKTFIVAKDLKSVVQLSPSGKTSFCTGDSVILTTNIETDQYIWKKDGIVLNRLPDKKIVVRESGNYTAELNGAVSNTITVTVQPAKLATASLADNLMIYEGQSAKLSVAFTNDSPWSFTYRDSTAAGLGTPVSLTTATTPYLIDVKPLKTTAYLLTNVSNSCGTGSLINRKVLVTVSSLLAADDPSLAAAVEIYPIPATSLLTIRINGLLTGQKAVLELMDMQGRLLQRSETQQTVSSFPVSSQHSGTYIVRVRVGERTASKRVIKL
ncbi:hypothetical protein GCM10028805_56650 [Spirosoma harenae]